MNHFQRQRRQGMTLVELLVVIAVIGLLAVTVLPNLANSSARRRVRESARSVASLIANAQSRAIGSENGAGIWLDILPTPAQGPMYQHRVCLDLSFADIPGSYRGETTNSAVFVVPDPNDTTKATLTPLPTFADLRPPVDSNAQNLFIKIGEGKSLFRLNYVFNSPTQTAEMDSARHQTPYNTVWPQQDPQNPARGHRYEIVLPPQKNPTQNLSLETDTIIDLTWTYFGTAPAQGVWPPSNSLSSNDAQLLYDKTGMPLSVIVNQSQGVPLLEPAFFLVTSIEAIQEGLCFTGGTSYWVAIDPNGGIPRVAEVSPPTGITGPWVPSSPSELINTQRFIRDAAFNMGG